MALECVKKAFLKAFLNTLESDRSSIVFAALVELASLYMVKELVLQFAEYVEERDSTAYSA